MLTVYLIQWRGFSAMNPAVILLPAVSLWSICYGLELGTISREFKVIWEKFGFLASSIIPTSLLLYSIQNIGRFRDTKRSLQLLLYTLPLFFGLLLFTNDLHHLMRTETFYEDWQGIVVSRHFYGPAYIFYILHVFIFLFGAIIQLLRNFNSPQYSVRNETRILLLAGLVPFIAFFLDKVGLNPLAPIEMTPFTFLFSLLLSAWGIFQLQMGEIVPFARNAVIEMMRDGVVVLDKDNRIMDLNPVAQRMSGIEIQTGIGKDIAELWPGWSQESLASSLPSEQSFQTALGAPGEERLFDIRVVPLQKVQEQNIGSVFVLRDITESEHISEELEELRAMQDTIVQTINEGIVIEDGSGCFAFANPAAEHMLGYEPGELVGEHWTNVIPEDQQPIVEMANERRARGEADRYEIKVLRKDGSRLDVLVSASPWDRGDENGGSMAAFIDISDLKKAEHALRESHERFLSVLDGIEADIYVADMETYEIILMNRHMRDSFGSDLVGKVCWQVFRGGEGPCPHCTNDELLDEDGKPAGLVVWEGQNPITSCWYLNYDRAIQWVDGRIVRLQIATDITELKEAGQEIRRRGEALEALRETSLAITSKLDLDELLHYVVERGCRLLDVRTGFLYLHDVDADLLEMAIAHGFTREVRGTHLAPGEGVAGRVYNSGEPFVISEYLEWEGRAQEFSQDAVTGVLGVPLRSGERVIGVLGFSEVDTPRNFDDHDIWLATLFANQASIAIENAHLFTDVSRQTEQLEVLRQVSHDLTALRDLETLLRQIVERAIRLLGGEAGGIYLYRPDRDVLEWVLAVGDDLAPIGTTMGKGEGLSGRVWEAGEPLAIENYDQWEGRSEQWAHYPGAIIAAPIRWGDQLLGVLNIRAREGRDEAPEGEAEVLLHFATQAAIAIQNARLYESQQRRLEGLMLLNAISNRVNSSLNLQEVLEHIVNGAVETFGADAACIHLLVQPQVAEVVVGVGLSDAYMEHTDIRPDGTTMTVIRTGEPLIIQDVELEPQLAKKVVVEEGVRSYIVLPLMGKTNAIGAMLVFYREQHHYSEDEVRLLMTLANQAAIAIENARLFNETEQWAQELAQSNAELSHFAYVASHDLQEPLRMVTSYLQLLERRYTGQLDETADEFIGFAVDGAKRMQALIQGLLAYSRIGTQGKEFVATDTAQVVEQVLSNLCVSVEENTATIRHNGLPVVNADGTQMTQLFQNLIGNAIKFRGEEAPKIEIEATRENGRWLFSIRDNGIGIDPDHHGRLFKIFQRLHAREQYPGTGIGLAVCKRIVERHGGEIWVESAEGQGSTFYFTLPVNKETGA
jgi:PAS domain S-box-containing protein